MTLKSQVVVVDIAQMCQSKPAGSPRPPRRFEISIIVSVSLRSCDLIILPEMEKSGKKGAKLSGSAAAEEIEEVERSRIGVARMAHISGSKAVAAINVNLTKLGFVRIRWF